MENLPAYIRETLEVSAKRIYDLTEERDKARAQADRLREGLDNAEGRARALLRDLVTCYNQADKARAEADRLRKALEEIAYERRLYEDNEDWFVPKEDKDFLRPARAEQSRQQYRARKALDAEDGDGHV